MQKIQSIDEQFHDGDGQTSMGTVVTAKFLNDVQNELCHVIDSAGIELDGQDDTQLLQAFLAVLRKNLSESDYVQRSDLDTKLDKTAKAADSDKLDGHDAEYFATASAVASAQRSADGKVSKSGDTMTGRLLFNLDTPIEVVNEKIWDQRSFIGMAIAIARIPSISGFWGKIYIEQNGRSFHAFTIQLHKDVNEEVFWTFRNNGHIHGPHGRLITQNDPSYDIGSYTIAVLRYTKYFNRNTLVSGAEFFDSNIGGDLGNDFKADRWWIGNHKVGNLPGTWRIMNPLDAASDYTNNAGWCTINLIKRVA